MYSNLIPGFHQRIPEVDWLTLLLMDFLFYMLWTAVYQLTWHEKYSVECCIQTMGSGWPRYRTPTMMKTYKVFKAFIFVCKNQNTWRTSTSIFCKHFMLTLWWETLSKVAGVHLLWWRGARRCPNWKRPLRPTSQKLNLVNRTNGCEIMALFLPLFVTTVQQDATCEGAPDSFAPPPPTPGCKFIWVRRRSIRMCIHVYQTTYWRDAVNTLSKVYHLTDEHKFWYYK